MFYFPTIADIVFVFWLIDGGAFVVLTEQGETLRSHFDAATYSSSNRWSHVSSTGEASKL